MQPRPHLSREPLSVGALKGQDVGKVVLILTLIVGTILSLRLEKQVVVARR